MKTEQPLLAYLLFTLFLGLKLTGEIVWSWWWVFSPLWGYAVFTLIAGFAIGFYRATRLMKTRRDGEGRVES